MDLSYPKIINALMGSNESERAKEGSARQPINSDACVTCLDNAKWEQILQKKTRGPRLLLARPPAPSVTAVYKFLIVIYNIYNYNSTTCAQPEICRVRRRAYRGVIAGIGSRKFILEFKGTKVAVMQERPSRREQLLTWGTASLPHD